MGVPVECKYFVTFRSRWRLNDVDPGWYPDPEVKGYVRWWTGRRWWGEPMPVPLTSEWPARVTRLPRSGTPATRGWLWLSILAVGLLMLLRCLGTILQ